MKLSQSISYPKWIVFQLLEHCNLRCSMCYEWGDEGSYHQKEELAILDYSIVKQVINDCLVTKPHFEFFGGEPLLYPQIWETIHLIKQGGGVLSFPTNGTLIKKYAELLVETKPNRVWISLDGTEEINDKQRGKGVFVKALEGIDKLYEIREAKKSKYPKIGITYIITPLNYFCLEDFFLKSINLKKIDYVSIECQQYAIEEQYQEYANFLKNIFGITSASCAKGYVQNPNQFLQMDFQLITQQLINVKKVCQEQNIYFISHPQTLELNNIENYFSAKWHKMLDKRSYCAFPWIYAEISAKGDVTVCHSFYDLPLGNVYEESILKIWNGERINQVRSYLKKQLYPICTACFYYYHNPLITL